MGNFKNTLSQGIQRTNCEPINCFPSVQGGHSALKEMNDALKTPPYKENSGGRGAKQTDGPGDYYVVKNAFWGWGLHTGRYLVGQKSESVPFLLLKRRRRKNENKPGDFSEPLHPSPSFLCRRAALRKVRATRRTTAPPFCKMWNWSFTLCRACWLHGASCSVGQPQQGNSSGTLRS